MKWPDKPIHRVIKLSVSSTYRSEAPRTHVPYNGKAIGSPNGPQMGGQEENADSKTERKPQTMVDISEQNSAKKASLSRMNKTL